MTIPINTTPEQFNGMVEAFFQMLYGTIEYDEFKRVFFMLPELHWRESRSPRNISYETQIDGLFTSSNYVFFDASDNGDASYRTVEVEPTHQWFINNNFIVCAQALDCAIAEVHFDAQ